MHQPPQSDPGLLAYPDGPGQRTRNGLLIALTLVVLAIVAVSVVVGVVLLGPGDAASPSAAASPSLVAIDGPAREMCSDLLQARLLDLTASIPPTGSTDKIKAYTARIDAQRAAMRSAVPAVRQLAAERPIDVAKLTAWCTANGQ